VRDPTRVRIRLEPGAAWSGNTLAPGTATSLPTAYKLRPVVGRAVVGLSAAQAASTVAATAHAAIGLLQRRMPGHRLPTPRAGKRILESYSAGVERLDERRRGAAGPSGAPRFSRAFFFR
jgi:hypothetical protein